MAPTIGATTGIQASPQRDGALVRDRQDGVQQTRHEVAGRVQARPVGPPMEVTRPHTMKPTTMEAAA